MKKYIRNILTILVTISILLSFISCGQKKAEDVKEKDNFDMKMASLTVENYVKFTKNQQYDQANSLVSDSVKINKQDLTQNGLKITGYKMLEMNESNEGGNFKIEVIKSNESKPETLITESEIIVKKEGIDYKINKINTDIKKEIFFNDGMLRLRKENEVDTNLVTDMQGLPKYAYSKDDKAKMKMNIVPKTNFGIIEFGYEGTSIAMTTFDSDTFIAILMLDDTMTTQGNNDNPQDQQSTGDQKGKNGGKILKEVPLGKKITSCDILTNSKVEFMRFSLDEKYLAVQYIANDNSKRAIRLYDTSNGDILSVNFEEEYPLNKVQVILGEFQNEKMKYKVIPKSESDKSNDYVGEWEMDLKELKLKKISK
ncbi:hypothetical protein RBU49_15650 [Clostridium sp. MB40-C1]|uniref:hypothetical protein n=1 Tax=Clostridium sp. MB40-C1 TaxID=3070996 RepID=UPI0027DF2567|nr:hypothetical protein [Clostridium sp. MB40-C1]WMJ80237.1 hypothetical protein RBU49_15650 [Clostridium sp. MB40-C1]